LKNTTQQQSAPETNGGGVDRMTAPSHTPDKVEENKAAKCEEPTPRYKIVKSATGRLRKQKY